MLSKLAIRGIGPMREVEFELDSRLNVITGDNGVGKSLILDVAFRAIAGTWAREVALPDWRTKTFPKIRWEVRSADVDRQPKSTREITFDPLRERWWRTSTTGVRSREIEQRTIVVYATVDDGFVIFDSARAEPDYILDLDKGDRSLGARMRTQQLSPYERGFFKFSEDEVFNGLGKVNSFASNGLLRDIPNWQYRHKDRFTAFKDALSRISKNMGEHIELTQPRRISKSDSREIPHLKLSYGEIPIVSASAGIKRIVSLAYILVWAWSEHIEASRLNKMPPASELLFLIDEVESHLHPRGQRAVLPSILATIKALAKKTKVQVLATTHSPLVLASLEPEFDEDTDQLLLVDLAKDRSAKVNQELFVRMGRADVWLTSEMFGLAEPTNAELEKIILDAEKLLSPSKPKPTAKSIRSIRTKLSKFVEDTDPLLARLEWLEKAASSKSAEVKSK